MTRVELVIATVYIFCLNAYNNHSPIKEPINATAFFAV